MIQTTTYSPFDLTTGTCPCCGDESNEIYVDDPEGRCINCIHDQDFYEMTMEGL